MITITIQKQQAPIKEGSQIQKTTVCLVATSSLYADAKDQLAISYDPSGTNDATVTYARLHSAVKRLVDAAVQKFPSEF